MSIDANLLKQVVEAAILAAGKPLQISQLQSLFEVDDEPSEKPSKAEVEAALEDIQNELSGRGFELKEVASGWRFQVKQNLSPWVGRLWDEKPQKYSRALLETLSLIAYRQPITRGEIEEIRGVAVSSHIVKTLSERSWVKVIGHKDVPGRPAMYATTKDFLDYFNMGSLEDLPTLSEIRDLDSMNKELNLEGVLTEAGIPAASDTVKAEFGLNDKLEGLSEDQISVLAEQEVLNEDLQAQERRLAKSLEDDLFDVTKDELAAQNFTSQDSTESEIEYLEQVEDSFENNEAEVIPKAETDITLDKNKDSADEETTELEGLDLKSSQALDEELLAAKEAEREAELEAELEAAILAEQDELDT